jgi:hypothetical protein
MVSITLEPLLMLYIVEVVVNYIFFGILALHMDFINNDIVYVTKKESTKGINCLLYLD